MSRRGAAQAIATLTAAYNREVPKPTLRIYLAELSDIDDGLLMAAALEIIRLSKFFPTIAEVRDAVIRVNPSSQLCPKVDKAWTEVLGAARELGRQQRPDWSHPAIMEALKSVGGYRAVCDSSVPGVVESRFREAYKRIESEHHRSLMLERGGEVDESATMGGVRGGVPVAELPGGDPSGY